MPQLTSVERWWLNAWPHRWHIRRQIPKFLKACPEPFRGEVLEVGAGSGLTSQRILQTFPQVELTATDMDWHAMEVLKSLQGAYGQRLIVQQADINRLPFGRESFDTVIAIHALHHLDDLAPGLQQLLRVLRPGGLLGIVDNDWQYMFGPLRFVRHRVSREDLLQLLQQENCDVLFKTPAPRFMIWSRKPYPVT